MTVENRKLEENVGVHFNDLHFEQLASIKYVSLGIIRDFKIVVSAGP